MPTAASSACAAARWASLTCGLAAAPVAPRRTLAGRFGIARTIARAPGMRARRSAMVLPARIETRSVSGPTSGAIVGAAAGSICGLIASTDDFGAGRGFPG